MHLVQRLNFHHLHYFWCVAHDGNLTRTAKRLRVSQSALSSQIRQLEARLGVDLFARDGRTLVVSEAGRVVLAFADDIFETGRALVSTFERGRERTSVLRVGAVATLSRNFQESFLRPLLDLPDVSLHLESGRLADLLDHLADHALDIVLSNRPVQKEPGRAWRSRRIARQPVSIIGHRRARRFDFPRALNGVRMILPSRASDMRGEFDALCASRGVAPRVVAEVDDMATIRLLARDMDALALVPSVVVRDELLAGVLHEQFVVPDLFETFYAVTVDRHFAHPLVTTLLSRPADQLLAMEEPRSKRRSRARGASQ